MESNVIELRLLIYDCVYLYHLHLRYSLSVAPIVLMVCICEVISWLLKDLIGHWKGDLKLSKGSLKTGIQNPIWEKWCKNNQNNRQAGELEKKRKEKNESSSSEHWASLSSTYMLWTIHYDPSHPTSGRQPVKGQVLTSQCVSSKLSLNESQGSSTGCLGPQVTSTGGPPKSLCDRNFIIIFALST